MALSYTGKVLTSQEAAEQYKLHLLKEKDRETFTLDLAPEDPEPEDWVNDHFEI